MALNSVEVSKITNDIKHMLWNANADKDMVAMSDGTKLCDKTLRKFRAQLKQVILILEICTKLELN